MRHKMSKEKHNHTKLCKRFLPILVLKENDVKIRHSENNDTDSLQVTTHVTKTNYFAHTTQFSVELILLL
jgi:hypothetical protein